MKIQEKLKYLQDNHFGEWLSKRQEVADKMLDRQSMFCLCGLLAKGLHERGCRKLQNKITSETIKKLEHLINKE